MYRGDYNGGNDGGGGGYDNSRRRKRSFDDAAGGDRQDQYDPRYNNNGGYHDDGGYNKRSRYEGGYRPRGNDNYRRDDDRYGGGRRYGGSGGGRFDRYSSGGGANGESDRARAWRLTKKAIVELGEATQLGDDVAAGPALRDNLQDAAAKVLAEMADAADEDSKRNHISALVLRCVSTLAHKTSLYAVLVGLVNEKNTAFGRKIVDAALEALQKDVDFFSSERYDADAQDKKDGDEAMRTASNIPGIALRVRLLVRFLGELVSTRVLKGEDLLSLLDTLQSVCTPEDFSAESDDAPLHVREDNAAFKDFYASVVLDTLLHCGRSLSVNFEDMYESLLSRCREYILNRDEESNPRGIETDNHATSWLVRRLRLDLVWEPETEEEQSAFCKKFDPLSLQWDALNLVVRAEPMPSREGESESASEAVALRWKIPGVLYPQEHFASHFQATEPHANTAPLTIDPSSWDATKTPTYSAVFRVLSEDAGAAGAAIADMHLASYLVIRDHLRSALETFQPKPAMAAKQLLSMCKNINTRYATDASGATPIKSEFLLLETLFVAALTEVSAPKIAYYCSVLYHLVKIDARVISAALAIIVELLFREIAFMNASAVDVLVKLFSHFLSNFEFKWPWANWTHVLEAQEDDAQRLFVSAVIERCVRLSYLQHMQSVLPSEFHMLLPPAPKPRIQYQVSEEVSNNQESGVTQITRNLYQAVTAKLKGHPPASALQSWIEEEIATLGDIDRRDVAEVVWTCILEAGAATFTHMRLLLEKYGHAESLFGGEDKELVLVKTVGFVWLKSPQHIGLILNMMLRQEIIRATTIAKWIFTPDAVQQYSWPYVWEILNETLAFVQASIARKTQQLETQATAKSGERRDTDETEMVDVVAVEDARKALQDELKQILILLFEGFNRVISEHKSNCDAEGISYKDNWFVSALAQMKAIGGKFRVALEPVIDELQTSVFSSNSADHDVKKVFQFVVDSYRSA
uniref:MIF4G domain-containing protein n=1 Tax=Globisporangium ultimum (strain ATCC 200006 / CBS 805.95 / DAOM BR144) TaxID=431595 RepID=K3WAB2_GLOUD